MKILICDDEYTNLEILKKHIMEYTAAHCIKADIYATTSPKEIFESSTSYDLAFLDIQMPDIDGISVAKELMNIKMKRWICTHSNFLINLLILNAFIQDLTEQ